MKSIGGYFELELRKGREFHPGAYAFNTARSALEVLLNKRGYKRVWVPRYYCESVLKVFEKVESDYEIYDVDKEFNPCLEGKVKDGDAIILVNYFGLMGNSITKLVNRYENVIVDNSQAFFFYPNKKEDTIYSCRKFFGVIDGSYLYSDVMTEEEYQKYPVHISGDSVSHLVGRIEEGPEKYYWDFRKNESEIGDGGPKRVSEISLAILRNIDYDFCERQRTVNFMQLHRVLKQYNELEWHRVTDVRGPLAYPFLTRKEGLRKKLFLNKIYTAIYWPSSGFDGEWEKYLAEYLVPLPVDQRYNKEDMDRILEVIFEL